METGKAVPMPTIHREANRRYVIFTNDHPPPHIHVKGPGSECRVRLQDVVVMDSVGFTQRELRDIVVIVRSHAASFKVVWDGIFTESR